MRNIPHSKLGNICLFTLLDFLSLGLLIRLSYFTIWITAASLQAAFKALSPSSSTHENATALSTLPMMLCPRWALVSVLHQSLLCYPLHILCCPVSFYFFFSYLLLHCSYFFYFTNDHNPSLFLFFFLPVNCSFLPYYSVWRFLVQNECCISYHAKAMLRPISSSRNLLHL